MGESKWNMNGREMGIFDVCFLGGAVYCDFGIWRLLSLRSLGLAGLGEWDVILSKYAIYKGIYDYSISAQYQD
jgi:hypothetical protein